jgi:FlaA1/EpsC-like NDP-sugar epimerase
VSLEKILAKFGHHLDNAVDIIEKAFLDLSKKVLAVYSYRTKNTQAPVHAHAKNSAVTATYFILLFDSFVSFLSIFISIHLRIGMDFLDYSQVYIIKNMLVFGLVCSSVFLWLQTHQSFWKYTSTNDIISLFLSVVLSNIIFWPLMILMNQEDFLPYSVLVINVFVLSFLIIIPRFVSCTLYNNRINVMKHNQDMNKTATTKVYTPPDVLLVGNSYSVEVFLRETVMNEDVNFQFEPVGVVSTSASEIGRTIRGVPIIGEVRYIGGLLKKIKNEKSVTPSQLIITDKNFPENMKRYLLKHAKEHNLVLMHVFHQYSFSAVTE